MMIRVQFMFFIFSPHFSNNYSPLRPGAYSAKYTPLSNKSLALYDTYYTQDGEERGGMKDIEEDSQVSL